jgi:hypothetical protein
MINERQMGKGWLVMFVCTLSSAVHVEFANIYVIDNFLITQDLCACSEILPESSRTGENS